ncbi:Protein of unknown function DUF1665 [Cynara cardunculus var. scolymus]|uniref:RRP15-like protein n=1 Tax=Cynara cardunculus var. scolymus TaxID=59895 RepID=A0A118K0T4_CYNCS|nr:Protein of unknown function DUF1665 [Cynara cardunculus var. scolymus]
MKKEARLAPLFLSTLKSCPSLELKDARLQASCTSIESRGFEPRQGIRVMAEEVQMQEVEKGPRKRKIGHKKGKGKKKMKVNQGSGQKVKMDGKMKKLFRKKARDYNSDDSDDANDVNEEEPSPPMKFEEKQSHDENEEADEKSAEEEADVEEDMGNDDISDDEEGIIEHGIMKFSEGSTSFKKAFKKIIKRSGSDDVLGPVLSAYKKLVVKKLAEEADERKVKGDAKKEKTLERKDMSSLILSQSRTKNYSLELLQREVNKAQSSQKGLNPSRLKDAKVIQKRRKEAFFSELGKTPSGSNAMVASGGDGEGPAWAPLRDNYMLTTAKLKDWDKAADATDDFGRQEDSSSDDDD